MRPHSKQLPESRPSSDAALLKSTKITVIVPAYRCAERIEATLAALPAFLDEVIVIDDASPDDLRERVAQLSDPRVRLVSHERNRGVGAAIASGYALALGRGAEVLVVMAGDNQMCPRDLEAVVGPVLRGEADYVKGNRLQHPEWRKMPWARRAGTRFLAGFTNLLGTFLGGLDIGDSQCGYTALRATTARELRLGEIYPRYGYPGHLLLTLVALRARIAEVPVRPVYQGERSGLRPYHILWISFIVLRRALVLAARRVGGATGLLKLLPRGS